jgi:CheY-like chemotaxis protein
MTVHILVVDDEHAIADSVREILVSAGYSVTCAYSGFEAVSKALKLCPDILLSDVLMPGMNGFEAALEIKKKCPACRLLFFSGQAATAQLAQRFVEIFRSRGYRFELLPKPLHPEALLSRIQDSLVRAG